MKRPYNFAPGPATLPEPVLERIRAEMLGHGDTGVSITEMSHRSSEFTAIIEGAEATLRELMGIPDRFRVLFLQGGASLQFAMVPMNLLRRSRRADFVNTGSWATRAIEETAMLGTAQVVASSQEQSFREIPRLDPRSFDPEADFFHVTTNNTIYGTRFSELPDPGAVPLVADMSSHILSEPIDVSRFGLIYAGAQKNIGPAGLTVVVIRNDLIGLAPSGTPTMLDYRTHSEKKSLYNTPPCFAIYAAGLVFGWVKAAGGVAAMAERNRAKAALLYEALDSSSYFRANVAAPHRSLMNVTFHTRSPADDSRFAAAAEAHGLLSLAGHRSAGGMRASLYNAMPMDGVRALVDFMTRHEKEVG